MEIDDALFDNLSKLCRIHFSEGEKKKLQEKLTEVLQYVDTLNEIDTDGVLPCNQVCEGEILSLREDLEGEILSREEFLKNSPSHVGGMIKVPPVIKFEE